LGGGGWWWVVLAGGGPAKVDADPEIDKAFRRVNPSELIIVDVSPEHKQRLNGGLSEGATPPRDKLSLA